MNYKLHRKQHLFPFLDTRDPYQKRKKVLFSVQFIAHTLGCETVYNNVIIFPPLFKVIFKINGFLFRHNFLLLNLLNNVLKPFGIYKLKLVFSFEVKQIHQLCRDSRVEWKVEILHARVSPWTP
jgi:hypothetical protein